MSAERCPIMLDVSRLISRAGRSAATGIDRVELAYAQHLIAAHNELGFAAVNAVGGIGCLAGAEVEPYIAALSAAWADGAARRGDQRHIRRLALGLRTRALLRGGRWLRAHQQSQFSPPIYLNVSHFRLEARAPIARIKRDAGARFVCLIHDLIPIRFPEYAKPGQDRRHRRRIETAAALSDAIIVASSVTRRELEPYLRRAGRSPPIVVAPFGCRLPAATPPPQPGAAPYFVCLGTIEGRKNHLLLLQLWRQLAADLGTRAPRLILVGQRGNFSQGSIDLLERCPTLRGLVVERNDLPDREMAPLLQGARALLLPSFAEGFGFPLIEALALGVPALCSDLPALRETGGDVPEFIDPLDSVRWREAILAYAAPASARRDAQLQRLAGWRPPQWEDHFAAIHRLLAEVAGAASPAGQ